MKKLIVLLLVAVALLLLNTGLVAADEGAYVRIVVPAAHISTAIQPIKLLPDGWEEPNHVNAWRLEGYPNAIFVHRDDLGAELPGLLRGDSIDLYQTYDFEDTPLRLRVLWIEVIDAADEDRVLDGMDSNTFALITCHPANDPEAPQRLIVWAQKPPRLRRPGWWRRLR